MDKKIIYLSRYSNKVARGVETHVEELSKRLSKFFTVRVFEGKDADNILKVIKEKPNLVIPTNGRLQSLKVGLGKMVSQYKVLIAGHAGVGRDDLWNLMTRPDVFVALTEFERRWAQKWGKGVKIVKIPNGIDVNKFNVSGTLTDIHLPKPVVLSVGALEWYKFHDRTIEAVSRTNASLLIIGKGSNKNELEQLGKKKLGERFKIINCDYSEMPKYYRSASLFTLPSWDREAFGIVYLEAMSSGLGVIAPDDMSRREIIGDAGIFVDTSDIDAFAQAIEKGLHTKWGSLPINQAEKFSWDKIATSYKKLIEDVTS